MVRNKKMSGFTLIELMVVIVIIGVLASLAIPRFTEASNKAKVAEAPRIIASYESAQLAYVAENGKVGILTDDDANQLIFDLKAVQDDSKWFLYEGETNADTTSAVFSATAAANMGPFEKDTHGMNTTVTDAGVTTRDWIGTVSAKGKSYVPNFMKNP